MSKRPFLTAEWRYLAMLNYVVEPELLLPLVPAGTELDTWQGRTYVSLVGFLFLNTRVMGCPIPMHRDFEEINLRFYVQRREADEVRRCVVFVREIVPNRAIAVTARALFNEKYVALPTRHTIERRPDGEIESVQYGWTQAGSECGLRVDAGGPSVDLAEDSEEEFIAQHYWGYTRRRDGGTSEYRVEHPRWQRIWPATYASFDGDPSSLYGPSFAKVLQSPPSSAFVAEGSAVSVHWGRRLQVSR